MCQRECQRPFKGSLLRNRMKQVWANTFTLYLYLNIEKAVCGCLFIIFCMEGTTNLFQCNFFQNFPRKQLYLYSPFWSSIVDFLFHTKLFARSFFHTKLLARFSFSHQIACQIFIFTPNCSPDRFHLVSLQESASLFLAHNDCWCQRQSFLRANRGREGL